MSRPIRSVQFHTETGNKLKNDCSSAPGFSEHTSKLKPIVIQKIFLTWLCKPRNQEGVVHVHCG